MSKFDQQLLKALRNARHLFVLTGAGVSAESGVPTFRDAMSGLWARFRPEDLAAPEAFAANPKRVWEWYAWRRRLCASAKPNPAHYALVEMERHVPRFTLATQNVDDLHRRAGSRSLIELHGNIHRTICSRERKRVEPRPQDRDVPPRCPNCGAPLRPDVVWFGEPLPEAAQQEALAAAADCDVCLSIGTSSAVYPAAALPEIALEAGATVVEINPAETPLSRRARYALRGPAGEILPALTQAAWPPAC